MKPIIEPVDKELLKAELTEETFLRNTNRAGNQIHVVDAQNAPHVLREIGRLREIAFQQNIPQIPFFCKPPGGMGSNSE